MKVPVTLKDELLQSGLFNEVWYVEKYKDVALVGIDPLKHFMSFGLMMERDPGPSFSTRFYKEQNPDVVKAGMIPLHHYLRYGIREGRQGAPDNEKLHGTDTAQHRRTSRLNQLAARRFSAPEAEEMLRQVLSAKLEHKPQRLFETFDFNLEEAVLAAAARLYLENRQRFSEIKASVIMPTYNRGDRITAAIQSVQAQSHQNFELLIIDDGSEDNSRSVLEKVSEDARIQVFWNNHLGVSAARNTGLQNASGQFVFYLDSDNVWTPDFLAAMLVAFDVSQKSCIYGASRLQNGNGELIGYRGEPFNWEQCVSGNYVDMNVFGHRLELVDGCGPFDTLLERMVDWDLILRYTRSEGAAYLPLIGCIYFEDGGDKGRITTSKPYIFRKIVHEKNRQGLASTEATFNSLSLSFAIKIPAPYEVRQAWGDFHYADSLKTALEALGHVVRIDFLEDWEKHPPDSTDCTIVLRGLTRYEPKPSEFSILWNISHPDQISYEEYTSYRIICVASASYAQLLSIILGRPVTPLLQCVDSERFSYRDYENRPGAPGVFVGNSRNEYREIVKWAVDAGADLEVYGQRWEKFLPEGMVKTDNVPNTELAATYAGGQFVLNDHWASMKHFGIVSNRVFDVVGCGGRLVSDGIASINDLCGGVVEIVDGPETLQKAVSRPLPPVSQAQRRAVAQNIHANHSFDARAKEIVSHIGAALLRHKHVPQGAPALSGPRRKRIGLLLQQGRAWPTSSAFIRLIAPLTTDYAYRALEIVQLDGAADHRLQDCDICIVQRIAVGQDADADVLLGCLEKFGIPLYVDTDDAFFLHEQHKTEDAVLRRLMAAAQETWFSTSALESLYAEIPGRKRVLRNTLDPRFWRNYRKPVRTSFDGDPIRFLYMGTATHDGDFQDVLPAFERLEAEMPGRFDLTIIGAVRRPPNVSWLRVLPPPAEKGSYPYFVRWLVENAQFDVGIAPLADTAFNRAKSDVKVLDYGAIGLLPVVSHCPAYAHVVAEGVAIGCGRDDWYDVLSGIIRTPDEFEAVRRRANEYVWNVRNTLQASETLVDLLLAP